MIFKTQNSTYEIDHDSKRVRRLTGAALPTARQGQDGEWKPFVEAVGLELGQQALFVWGNNPDGSLKCTQTGIIVELDAAPIN